MYCVVGVVLRIVNSTTDCLSYGCESILLSSILFSRIEFGVEVEIFPTLCPYTKTYRVCAEPVCSCIHNAGLQLLILLQHTLIQAYQHKNIKTNKSDHDQSDEFERMPNWSEVKNEKG